MTKLLSLPACSNVEAHEQVELFPTFAYEDPKQSVWHVSIAGMAFCQGDAGLRQRMFLRLLRQLLRVDLEQLQGNLVFGSRIRGFLIEPQKSKQIVVRIGGELQMLRKSRRNGHFRGKMLISADALKRMQQDAPSARSPATTVGVKVVLPTGDDRTFHGRVQFVPRGGLSVISDIDDTIKVSEVAHRRQLLHNTFLRPFMPVPGMADLYRHWASCGAAFHYVSSSPWQLYEPLAQLLQAADFPIGSFHLRSIRFRDPTVLRLFASRKRNKYRVIRTIFRIFPERRFVLVGDSGEKDPEIYGAIARKFPRQIERILIRRVEGRPWTRKRCRRVFERVPRSRWQTFRVPAQIRDVPVDRRR